jgi:hypothetical protein
MIEQPEAIMCPCKGFGSSIHSHGQTCSVERYSQEKAALALSINSTLHLVSAHASLKDSFAALGSRMQPMPVKPLPDGFDCEGAGAGQGFQQLPSRLDDDAYVSLQALPSDLDPDAAFGEGCVPPMELPSELLPEAHLQEGGNAGGGVRQLPSRLDEDELAGSQQVQPSSWPNPAHRGQIVRAAVQIRIKKNRKIKKTRGPESGHGLPNVSTSVSLPWGKALRVDEFERNSAARHSGW